LTELAAQTVSHFVSSEERHRQVTAKANAFTAKLIITTVS